MKILVAGSGGWGTALAMVLHRNGNQVSLWSYCKEESENLSNTLCNPFLPGVELPRDMIFTSSCEDGATADMVVFATPSFAVRGTAKSFAPFLREDAILVCVTKGIEQGTGYCMSQVIEQETGKTVVALSGPSHAEEVSRRIPTGVVAACEDKTVAEKVQQTFMNDTLRVYTCPDTVGVELGAAHKNVIALCAGICDGMGYGDNTKALLMTRGLAELARLGMAMGAKRETFAGLAGVGDLIVTCTSMHSRNRRAGILIGEGNTPKEAMDKVGAVVEGYYAAKSAYELAQANGVDMPITRAAYEVLYENKDPRSALADLMHREQTSEVEDAAWAR